MFLIQRRADGKYVSPPGLRGLRHSYTARIDLARVYQTKEEAERDLCPENETIVSVVSVPDLFRTR